MIEFNIPTMTCGHCVKTVTRTVQRIDPAATVEIDLAAKRVRIASAMSPGSFGPALAEEGYAAQPVGSA